MSLIELDGARRTIVRLCVIVLAAGCTRGEYPVTVERAALTLDVAGATAAVYFTVRDAGSHADTLIGVSAEGARWVSMQSPQSHRVPGSGGAAAMLMTPVARVPLSVGRPLRFAPGGFTGLLEGVQRDLAEGDSVLLTLRFSSGRSASRSAPVLAFAELERALASDDATMSPSPPPSLAEGSRLYRANGCVSCHGLLGWGDGPVGLTLMPPPRDFRDTLAFKSGRRAEQIARTLAIGIPGGGNMPLYAHLSNTERASLALHLISLRTTHAQRSNTP